MIFFFEIKEKIFSEIVIFKFMTYFQLPHQQLYVGLNGLRKAFVKPQFYLFWLLYLLSYCKGLTFYNNLRSVSLESKAMT